MTNVKISDLTANTAPAITDLFELETAAGASGRCTGANLAKAITTANLPAVGVDWTPVVTCETGAITSYTINQAKWLAIGKFAFIDVKVTLTDAGTGSNTLYISLPFTLAGTINCLGVSLVTGTTYTLISVYGWTGTTQMYVDETDGTTCIGTGRDVAFSAVGLMA